MAIELRPKGTACNIACQYCYQNALRDVEGAPASFDFDAVSAAALAAREPLNLFGGEPLLLPLGDLERVFAFNLAHFGVGGTVQTNGTLVTPAHVEMFTRYEIRVGISIDGPDELNDARWAGSLERTRKETDRTLRAIHVLSEAGRPPSLMVQITRFNGVGDRLVRLCKWLAEMDELGCTHARIHVLELDESAAREAYGLTVAESVESVAAITSAATRFKCLKLDIAEDCASLLMMQDEKTVCTFRACDPLVTPAVNGVGPKGEPHKCGLTDKEGINFLRPDAEAYERYIALYWTPQRVGGCHDCRFFAACKGQCPGTGIDGDWRNRSENCEVWRQLFSHAEALLLSEGRTPLSVHPRRGDVEDELLKQWALGMNPSLAWLREQLAIQI